MTVTSRSTAAGRQPRSEESASKGCCDVIVCAGAVRVTRLTIRAFGTVRIDPVLKFRRVCIPDYGRYQFLDTRSFSFRSRDPLPTIVPPDSSVQKWQLASFVVDIVSLELEIEPTSEANRLGVVGSRALQDFANINIINRIVQRSLSESETAQEQEYDYARLKRYH